MFIIGLSLSAFAMKAGANPSGFYQSYINTAPGVAGNIATTSVVYMTPGTATSTIYWDSSLSGASAQGSESAALTVQLTGSSTATVLQMNQEFAQGASGVNCVATPGNCDWYQLSPTGLNGYATTTIPMTFDQVAQLTWKTSTSSPAGLGVAGTNVDTRIVMIQTPTKYTRVVFTLKIGGANASVWADIVAKKQNP